MKMVVTQVNWLLVAVSVMSANTHFNEKYRKGVVTRLFC